MTPIQKQCLRENLLRQLEVVRSGLPFNSLRSGANAGAFRNTPDVELENALDWLVRREYAVDARSEWSDVLRIWRITPKGLEFLDR